MTFEEWNKSFKGFIRSDVLGICKTTFQAGAASRDAEVQRLQMALADAEALELGTAEKCDQLRAELVKALAACKVKDEALMLIRCLYVIPGHLEWKTSSSINCKEKQMNTIKLTKENVLSLIGRYAAASSYRTVTPLAEEQLAQHRKGVEQAIDNLFAALEGKVSAINTELDEKQGAVFDAIGTERTYQEHKWGTLEEHQQSVGGYLTLMRVHLAKAEAAWAGADNDKEALECLRKVLAIGVACGEQHGLPPRNLAAYKE